MLAETLQSNYGKAGLIAECRPFKDISELKQAGLTLVVVKYSILEDHWVAIIQVTDSEVGAWAIKWVGWSKSPTMNF